MARRVDLEARKSAICDLLSLGCTQAEAARRLGLSQQQVSYALGKGRARPHRLVQISLREIPLKTRMHAAQQVCRYEGEEEREDIFISAMFPSDTKYWIRDYAAHLPEALAA